MSALAVKAVSSSPVEVAEANIEFFISSDLVDVWLSAPGLIHGTSGTCPWFLPRVRALDVSAPRSATRPYSPRSYNQFVNLSFFSIIVVLLIVS